MCVVSHRLCDVHLNMSNVARVQSSFDIRTVATFSAQPSLWDLPSADEVIINCPWHGQKINYPLLQLLRQIVQQSQRPLLFRFFLGAV